MIIPGITKMEIQQLTIVYNVLDRLGWRMTVAHRCKSCEAFHTNLGTIPFEVAEQALLPNSHLCCLLAQIMMPLRLN